VDCITCIYISF